MTEDPKAKTEEKAKTQKETDKTIEDSFPASDPPAWTGVTGSEEPK